MLGLLKDYSKQIVTAGIAAGVAFTVPTVLGNYFKEEKFNLEAVIDDPDGFTNVRSQADRQGQIVAKIQKNEIFYTYDQDKNWWQVRTSDGKTGYVHITRIKLKK